jgi:hypothetical protein
MRRAVFSPKDATDAVVELKKAAAGEPASTKKLAAFAGSWGTRTARAADDAAEVPADNMTASFWALVCGDNSAAWSRDPESYRQEAIEERAATRSTVTSRPASNPVPSGASPRCPAVRPCTPT